MCGAAAAPAGGAPRVREVARRCLPVLQGNNWRQAQLLQERGSALGAVVPRQRAEESSAAGPPAPRLRPPQRSAARLLQARYATFLDNLDGIVSWNLKLKDVGDPDEFWQVRLQAGGGGSCGRKYSWPIAPQSWLMTNRSPPAGSWTPG